MWLIIGLSIGLLIIVFLLLFYRKCGQIVEERDEQLHLDDSISMYFLGNESKNNTL